MHTVGRPAAAWKARNLVRRLALSKLSLGRRRLDPLVIMSSRPAHNEALEEISHYALARAGRLGYVIRAPASAYDAQRAENEKFLFIGHGIARSTMKQQVDKENRCAMQCLIPLVRMAAPTRQRDRDCVQGTNRL